MEGYLLKKFEKYLAAFIKNWKEHKHQIKVKFLSSAARIQKVLLNEDLLNEIVGFPMVRFRRVWVSELRFKFPATSFTKEPMRLEIDECEVEIDEPETLEQVHTNILSSLGIDLTQAAKGPHKYGTEDRLGDGISIYIRRVHVKICLRGNAPPLHLILHDMLSVCCDASWNSVELTKSLPRYKKAIPDIFVFRRTDIRGISMFMDGDLSRAIMTDVPCEVHLTMKKKARTAEVLGLHCDVIMPGIEQYVTADCLRDLIHWAHSMLMCIYRDEKIIQIEKTYEFDEELTRPSATDAQVASLLQKLDQEDDDDDDPSTRLKRSSSKSASNLLSASSSSTGSLASVSPSPSILHPRVEFVVSITRILFHVRDERPESCDASAASAFANAGFTMLVRNLLISTVLPEDLPMSEQHIQISLTHYQVFRVNSFPVLDDYENPGDTYFTLAEPVYGRPIVPPSKPAFNVIQPFGRSTGAQAEDVVRLKIQSAWPAKPFPDCTFSIDGWISPVAARLRLDALLSLYRVARKVISYSRGHLSGDVVLYCAIDVLLDHVDVFLPNPLMDDPTFANFLIPSSAPVGVPVPESPLPQQHQHQHLGSQGLFHDGRSSSATGGAAPFNPGAAYMIYSGDRLICKLSPVLSYIPSLEEEPLEGPVDASVGHMVHHTVPWDQFTYKCRLSVFSQTFVIYESLASDEGKRIVQPFDTRIQFAFWPIVKGANQKRMLFRRSESFANLVRENSQPEFFIQIDNPTMQVDVNNSLLSAAILLRIYSGRLLEMFVAESKNQGIKDAVAQAVKDPQQATSHILSTLASPSRGSRLSERLESEDAQGDAGMRAESADDFGTKIAIWIRSVPLFLAFVNVGRMQANPIVFQNVQLVLSHTNPSELPHFVVKQLVSINGMRSSRAPHVLQTVFAPDCGLSGPSALLFSSIRHVDKDLAILDRFVKTVDHVQMFQSLSRLSVAELSSRLQRLYDPTCATLWEAEVAYYEFRAVGSGRWQAGCFVLQPNAVFCFAKSDVQKSKPLFAVAIRPDSAIEYFRNREMLRMSYGAPDALSCAVLRSGDVSLLFGSVTKSVILDSIEKVERAIKTREVAEVREQIEVFVTRDEVEKAMSVLEEARMHLSNVRSYSHARHQLFPADQYIRRIASSSAIAVSPHVLPRDASSPQTPEKERLQQLSQPQLVQEVLDRDLELALLRARVAQLEAVREHPHSHPAGLE
eukprot:ANDGO_02143.mRNA.1 hypothetical protein